MVRICVIGGGSAGLEAAFEADLGGVSFPRARKPGLFVLDRADKYEEKGRAYQSTDKAVVAGGVPRARSRWLTGCPASGSKSIS